MCDRRMLHAVGFGRRCECRVACPSCMGVSAMQPHEAWQVATHPAANRACGAHDASCTAAGNRAPPADEVWHAASHDDATTLVPPATACVPALRPPPPPPPAARTGCGCCRRDCCASARRRAAAAPERPTRKAQQPLKGSQRPAAEPWRPAAPPRAVRADQALEEERPLGSVWAWVEAPVPAPGAVSVPARPAGPAKRRPSHPHPIRRCFRCQPRGDACAAYVARHSRRGRPCAFGEAVCGGATHSMER